MPTPEDKTRDTIDRALEKAGWKVQDTKSVNLNAGRGVAIRNFPLTSSHGFADYLLYVDGKAVGVIEAKKEGFPLVGVEVQAVKYSEGLPSALPAYIRPLPFLYQSTGIETRFTIVKASGGHSLKDLSRLLVEAVNPDRQEERSRQQFGTEKPTEQQMAKAAAALIQEAVMPFQDPTLREVLIEIKKKNELVIDHVSQDQVIEAGFSAAALERARTLVQSFEQFIEKHKDEITALQILYSKPYKQRLTFESIKELADAIEKPPYLWNESQLWQAYAALEESKVKGASGKRILTDLVSLVRFAIHQDNELVPFPERVKANFNAWLGEQESPGKKFTEAQHHWLNMIRDHIAANLGIGPDDFEYAPFSQAGGLGRAHRLFPEGLQTIIESLNVALVA